MARWMRYAVPALAALLVGAALFTSNYWKSPGPLPVASTVILKKGQGFEAIVDTLHENRVIDYPLLFKAISVLSGNAKKFKAGEYAFPATVTPMQAMSMIATGQVVVHKMTLPEGITVREVIDLLNKETVLEGTMSGVIAEGTLLPETYHFTYGDTRQGVLARMQTAMQKALAEAWAKRKEGLPLKSPQEALILASIVEKETGVPEERPRVAAVFINRLRKGMKLQTDPTVMYAIEKDKGPMTRALMSADLTYASPYNTYVVDGLPPGPIANPGLAAIHATLNPPETDELYFVATGTGGHNFSATLAGHNQNVNSYRKALKRQKQP